MQKVITITTHTNLLTKDIDYIEKEYEKLNGYLTDGYTVLQMVPFTTGAADSFRYSITFVLEKKDQQ